MLSTLSTKPPMAGRSTSATTSGTWPWKDGTRSLWRSYPLLLLLINNPTQEALLVEFLEISCSSRFPDIEVVCKQVELLSPSAAFFKLLNLEKKSIHQADVDYVNLMDDKMTIDV